MSDVCKTVKVKGGDDFIVINESDYDPKVHKLAEGEIAPPEPDDGDASAGEIVAAIADLDPDNDDHWTQGGLPDVGTVARAIDKKVTRAAIDAAAGDAKRPE